MSKIKTVTTYKASDGKEFDSAEENERIESLEKNVVAQSTSPRHLKVVVSTSASTLSRGDSTHRK